MDLTIIVPHASETKLISLATLREIIELAKHHPDFANRPHLAEPMANITRRLGAIERWRRRD